MYKGQKYDKGDVILSVGAFSKDTLECWQAHSPVLVVDYEAGPDTFKGKKPLEGNNGKAIGKLELHPEAVTDKNGVMILYKFKGGPLGDSIYPKWQKDISKSEYFDGEVKVKTVSMASILRTFPVVRECYMNCEGSEIPILLNTPLNLLGRCQYLCVEFHRFSSFLDISNGDVLRCVERLRPLFNICCIEDYHPAYEFTRKP